MDESAGVSNKKQKFNIRKISFGKSRAYLAEYGLMLILVLALVNIFGMMLQEIVGKQASFLYGQFSGPIFPYFPGFFGDMTIEILAGFLVVFPAVIILIQRTGASELEDPEIKKLGWRKGLLSLFLVVSMLWAIVSLISVLVAGLNYLSMLGTESATFDWREASENGLRAVLFILAGWALGSDYRRNASEKTAKVMHVFRYGIVVVGLVLLAFFGAFPFQDNKAEATDNLIMNDLTSIQNKVNEKYNNSQEYPKDLEALGLSDDEKNRAKENNYKYDVNADESVYKICATFMTDTRSMYGPGYIEMTTYPSTYADYGYHDKGEKCFDIQADAYGPTDDSPYGSSSIDYQGIMDSFKKTSDSIDTELSL